jgi:hypothetical protein
MATRTTNKHNDFKLAPAGMHVARCFRVIDCGTHVSKKYGTKQRLGYVFFELPNELMEANDKGEQKPYTVRKQYVLSHGEKAMLRKDLESWYGKKFVTADLDNAGGFDLSKLLGRPAFLNVVHSDDGKYANITSINPIPAGFDCPAQINPIFGFWIEEDLHSSKFSELSEKMQGYIKESDEYINSMSPGKITVVTGNILSDDIPFNVAPY